MTIVTFVDSNNQVAYSYNLIKNVMKPNIRIMITKENGETFNNDYSTKLLFLFNSKLLELTVMDYNFENKNYCVFEIPNSFFENAEFHNGDSVTIVARVKNYVTNEFLNEETAFATVYMMEMSLQGSIEYINAKLCNKLGNKGIILTGEEGLLSLVHKVKKIPYPPFRKTIKQLLNENQEPISLQSSIDLKSLIQGKRESLAESYMLDPNNYTFIEGNASNITVTGESIKFTSRSVVAIEPPLNSKRWAFTFNLTLSNSSRWYIYIGSANEKYGYGMDIISVDSPHYDHLTSNGTTLIPTTYSNVDFPRNTSFDFTVIRYDNNYIVAWKPSNQEYYVIAILPNMIDMDNGLGFSTWSFATFTINNMEFYTL